MGFLGLLLGNPNPDLLCLTSSGATDGMLIIVVIVVIISISIIVSFVVFKVVFGVVFVFVLVLWLLSLAWCSSASFSLSFLASMPSPCSSCYSCDGTTNTTNHGQSEVEGARAIHSVTGEELTQVNKMATLGESMQRSGTQ